MTSSAQEVLDDAFDCARAALQAAPDRGSARRILEVLRARVDATMTLSTTSPGDEREELSSKQIEAGWHKTFSTSNPFCPCDLKSFTKAVRWAERALSSSTVQQVGADAMDAARWRRLVNASEMPFPVATIADDPENDCTLIYGRTGLERLIDSYDEISDTYQGDQQ